MTFIDLLPAFMFVVLAIMLFSGFPVGFVLGGVGLIFAGFGYYPSTCFRRASSSTS